jgi:hypothetical protein
LSELLGAGEEVYEVAGGGGDRGMDSIDEVGDRVSGG